MPNFWTATARSFYEMFAGPRTKDAEFDKKVEQLKLAEKSVTQVKSIYSNFYRNTSGFKVLCRDIYQNLSFIYNESSPYWPMIKTIIAIYTEAEKLYNYLEAKVEEIEKIGEEWDKKHKDVSSSLVKREQSRRVYDHYDEKLQKIYKTYKDKSVKDDYFLRNEQKYKTAIENYVKLSEQTYEMMSDLIHFRLNYINPTIVRFVSEHKRFFDLTSQLFQATDELDTQMLDISRVHKPVETYNPRKYIHGLELLGESDKNQAQDVIQDREVLHQLSQRIESVNVEIIHHPENNVQPIIKEEKVLTSSMKRPYTPEEEEEIVFRPTRIITNEQNEQIEGIQPEDLDYIQHNPELDKSLRQSEHMIDLDKSNIPYHFKTSSKNQEQFPVHYNQDSNNQLENKHIIKEGEFIQPQINYEDHEIQPIANPSSGNVETFENLETNPVTDTYKFDKYSQTIKLGEPRLNLTEEKDDKNLSTISPKSHPLHSVFHHEFNKGEKKRADTMTNKRYIL